MKRALPIALGVVVLPVAGVLIAPSFIDWNKYKPQIVEQAKTAAGYDLKIDGDIKLSVLPMPQLKVEGVSVLAPRGKEVNLLTMKQANVSINLLPLISGDISINTVRLVNPEIRLEILPDGSNSWMSDKLLNDQKQAGNVADTASGSSGKKEKSVALNKLIIQDGSVSYSDRSSGKTHSAEKINLDIKADTLSGPFEAGGSLTYAGKVIELDAKTKKMTGGKKEFPAEIRISLPESNASAEFDGIVALAPLEIQGKMNVKADNLGAVLALAGGEPSSAMARKLAFSGLVTMNEQQFSSQEIDITFGDTKGKGNIALTNLKEKNPVALKADMAFQGILNMDQLAPGKDKNKEPSVEEKVAKGQTLSAKSSSFIPETLSLPFPVDGTLIVTAEGVQTAGKVFKGISLDVSKVGPAIDVNAKATDIPGKTKAEGKAAIRYATASKSGDTGITYADPSVTFTAAGASEQLPTLLRSFASGMDGNAALEIYKMAQFDLSGTVSPTTINVANSTLKLDQTTIALAGFYKPNGSGGRPDVMIDLTTDTVDIDNIQSRLNGQKKQAVQQNAAAKPDVKKALEPVRDFSMPVNLTFDLSAQKAIFDAQEITGIRLKGRAAGESLALETVSAQNFRGAAGSLKGTIGNLKDLSGIDMSFYGKTSDLKALMQSFKMDTSKLPQSISGAEANIKAKGTAESLAVDADVAALNGSLQASGNMTGLLDTPSFSNLTLGAKHPNFVKAIQIINPAFTGGPGLERPFDFYTKAVANGKVYDLTDLKTSIGAATFGGAIKVDTGAAKPSITGSVQAGTIPLDDLLGAKTGAANAGGSAGGGAASASTGGGKWSRATLETGWMHSVNLDLALAAQSITYGGWNFTKPNTKIVLKDGNLIVDNLQSGLFGGTANLTAKVQDPVDAKQPLSMAIDTKMTNVALEQLAYAMSGSSRIKSSGDVSLDLNTQTSGLSPHALVSGLQGKANLNGTSVVFKGFDLAQIGLAFVDTGKPLDRLQGVVGGATQSGETRFDTIKGTYDIAQGIATISSMEMDGPAANIKSKGNVNLPLWTIDTLHTLTFKNAKEAGSFDVAIKGSLSSPANTFGKGLFNDVLTRRLQGKLQEKLGEKIQDKLGDDLTGKLQGLGILPPKAAPAPMPTQPATIPDAPAPATPDTVPAPAAQPQLTPEQQRQQDTEKAIQGVIKGLF